MFAQFQKSTFLYGLILVSDANCMPGIKIRLINLGFDVLDKAHTMKKICLFIPDVQSCRTLQIRPIEFGHLPICSWCQDAPGKTWE